MGGARGSQLAVPSPTHEKRLTNKRAAVGAVGYGNHLDALEIHRTRGFVLGSVSGGHFSSVSFGIFPADRFPPGVLIARAPDASGAAYSALYAFAGFSRCGWGGGSSVLLIDQLSVGARAAARAVGALRAVGIAVQQQWFTAWAAAARGAFGGVGGTVR